MVQAGGKFCGLFLPIERAYVDAESEQDSLIFQQLLLETLAQAILWCACRNVWFTRARRILPCKILPIESYAPRCAGFDVHSLSSDKERTKKTDQGIPLGTHVRAQTTFRYFGFAEMATPLMFARIDSNSDFAFAF